MVALLFTGLLSGILLYIVGGLMRRRELNGIKRYWDQFR